MNGVVDVESWFDVYRVTFIGCFVYRFSFVSYVALVHLLAGIPSLGSDSRLQLLSMTDVE